MPRDEEYACKAFVELVKRNAILIMNIDIMSCHLVHPLFRKLLAIHLNKVHGLMRRRHLKTSRQIFNNGKKKIRISREAHKLKAKMLQRHIYDYLGNF